MSSRIEGLPESYYAKAVPTRDLIASIDHAETLRAATVPRRAPCAFQYALITSPVLLRNRYGTLAALSRRVIAAYLRSTLGG
jgi:hypothetical protein